MLIDNKLAPVTDGQSHPAKSGQGQRLFQYDDLYRRLIFTFMFLSSMPPGSKF